MCLIQSYACCCLIISSSILWLADGAVDGELVQVVLGVHPMISENGVSFIVAFGHEL